MRFSKWRNSNGEVHRWRNLLVECLPDSMRQRFRSRVSPYLVAVLDEHHARLERNGRFLGDIHRAENAIDPGLKALLLPHEYPLVLLLPPDWILKRRIALPAAAAENLRQVLEYELDRVTPFSASQVYLDYRVDRGADDAGMLAIDLVVVPRQKVDDWLALLNASGISVDRVTAEGFWDDMNLLPPDQRPRLHVRRVLWRSLPTVLVVVLVFASLAFPLWQKRKIAIELQAREAALRNRANQVVTLRQQLESKTAELQKVHDQWRSAPPVLDVLLLLTNLLPDHTYLQQLNIKGSELTIRGLSEQASSLIALLEESPAFGKPHFLSPVTQQRGKELFHLSATIKQPFPKEALELVSPVTDKSKPAEPQVKIEKERTPLIEKQGRSEFHPERSSVAPPVSEATPRLEANPESIVKHSQQNKQVIPVKPLYVPENAPVGQRILSGGG